MAKKMTLFAWSRIRNRIIQIFNEKPSIYPKNGTDAEYDKLVDYLLEDNVIQKWIKPYLDVRTEDIAKEGFKNYLMNLVQALDETGILPKNDFADEDELMPPNSGFAG